ncbi:MAG: protein arginine kinase [Clostridiales bacterium]|jgi:protein arginine kinase|nr:protein arginine kinase [Clostridiales bacterium]
MTPWYQEALTDENEILSSRVRLARNIKRYPFRRKMTSSDAAAMVSEASEAVTMAGNFFRKLEIQTLAKTEQTVFLEKHIISPEFLNGNLPKGLLISDDQNVSIMLNEEDHVRIQAIKPGEGLTLAYETAGQIDDLIEERVEFAFHTDYGYLTACPTNTGTGLRASYMIHLPCLTKSDLSNNLLQQITKFGVAIRGIYGEGTAPMGSIYQISNQKTLGKSEEEIILSLQNVTRNVISNEQKARETLLTTRKSYLEDAIYRAYGILSNARMISAKEAMDLLSDIRLGFITKILDAPKPAKQIYQIMMEIQPGHLQRNAGEEMSEQERDITRAAYLREIFSS